MIKCSKPEKNNNRIPSRNHKYLRLTSLLLIVSVFYFLFNKQEVKKPFLEYLLASFLIIVIIFSQFFWNNPIKQSNIHKIDAIIAKIVSFSFILYTLLYKFKISYLLLLLIIVISFYLSNYYSTQEWCCNEHIFWHGSLHIFGFISTFYTFFRF